jgi:hypothetical protein
VWSNALGFTVPAPGGNGLTLQPSLLNMVVGDTHTIQALSAAGQSVTEETGSKIQKIQENTGKYRDGKYRKIQGQPELRYLFRWSLLLRSLFQNGANRSARSLAWRRSLRNATQFRLSRYSPFRSFVACFHGRRSRTSSDENGGAGRRCEVAVSAAVASTHFQ